MELYRNELGTVRVDIPSSASGATAQIKYHGVTSSLGLVTVTDGIASVDIPFNYTQVDDEFDVVFSFSVGSIASTLTERVQVVTPLVRRSAVASGYDETEPLVRAIIYSITGQTFGKWTGTYTVKGQGEKSLALPNRLLSLTTLNYNGINDDIELYDVKGDNWFLFKTSSDGLTVRQAPPEESIEVVISGGHPIFYPFGKKRGFSNDRNYLVTGTWGYESVPSAIQQAAKLLFDDLQCSESTYRNKYITEVQTQTDRFKFGGGAWEGTGNAIVDALLAPYTLGRMFAL